MLALFKSKKHLLVKKSVCFSKCTEVVMTAFIAAIVHHDLTCLIKSGKPLQAELETAWDKIFNEYLTISGDSQIQQILALLKEIAIITNKLTLIEIIVNQMAIKHNPGLADQLRSLGFRFQYNDDENLLRELELTITQSKAHLLTLQQNKAELEELRKNEGGAATEMDYEMQLSELSKFQGFQLDPDKLTVSAYCAILKRFKNFYKPQV
jgi:hypothetical protein